MWESFIFSWAWEGRRHTWRDVKAKAKANQWYLEAGRRIVALASLDPRRHNIKDDSFWAGGSFPRGRSHCYPNLDAATAA
ncbi:MAG: hypothetical protein ACOX1P_33140 [Thermoguttaceae bacterium]|jgi:hypothetical protein